MLRIPWWDNVAPLGFPVVPCLRKESLNKLDNQLLQVKEMRSKCQNFAVKPLVWCCRVTTWVYWHYDVVFYDLGKYCSPFVCLFFYKNIDIFLYLSLRFRGKFLNIAKCRKQRKTNCKITKSFPPHSTLTEHSFQPINKQEVTQSLWKLESRNTVDSR